MASYYDRVLEDFDMREGILDEGILDEGIYDEGVYDEGILDEASGRRKRPVKVPASVGRPADFGRNVRSSNGAGQGNYVTKADLRNSLNSISSQVNDLKKSSLTLASSIKRLDDGYEKVVKSIARKDRSQDSLASNSTMMSLVGTLINKPTLNTDALEILDKDTTHPTRVKVKDGQDAIQVDLTKTLLFTMLPAMMAGGNGDNSMMMIMMVLLLGQKPPTGTSSNDNTMLMMIPMMMMMSNNKK